MFSFEAASVTGYFLEGSPPSELVPVEISVAALRKVTTSTISHSIVSIFLQTLAPHLTRLLSQFAITTSIIQQLGPMPRQSYGGFLVVFYRRILSTAKSLYFHDLGWARFLWPGSSDATSYIENIERIGGSDRASSYRAYLQALDQHLITLNNLHQANMSAIVGIEVAHACVELHILGRVEEGAGICSRNLGID